MVRGYSIGSFDMDDCGGAGNVSGCPRIDRLTGSRVGIVNLEIRLPLLGTERFGVYDFPYLPAELSLFPDGGLAWTKVQQPELKLSTDSRERVPVFSAGAATRINVANYLVIQTYLAYPFQRPGKG